VCPKNTDGIPGGPSSGDQALPSQRHVPVATQTSAGTMHVDVQLNIIRRSSRPHRPVVGVRRLEEDSGLIGAEVLFVGKNVTSGRRRLATADNKTTTN